MSLMSNEEFIRMMMEANQRELDPQVTQDQFNHQGLARGLFGSLLNESRCRRLGSLPAELPRTERKR